MTALACWGCRAAVKSVCKPSSSSKMNIHLPSFFLFMVYVNAVLAASFVVAAIGAQRDLRLWAGALVLHLVGYLALVMRSDIPELASVLVANLAFGGLLSLFVIGVNRLRGRPSRVQWTVWPVVAMGAVAVGVPEFGIRTTLTSSLMLLQAALLLHTTVGYRRENAGRGADLLIAGALIWSTALLVRIVAEVSGWSHSASVSDPTWSQLILYLASLSATILIAISVPMMLRERSDAALQASERHYRRLIESANEGVVIVSDLLIRYANPAACGLLGAPAGSLIDRPYLDHLHPDDRELSMRVHQLRLQGQADHQSYEVRLRRSDGAQRWVRVNGVRYDWNGQPATLSFMADITEQHQAHEKDREMAFVDPLTGLDNRRRFLMRMHEALEQAKADKHVVGVVFLDLDNFKPLNDEHGHAAGDELLIQVGQRLRQRVRSTDAVARLGGDEFVVLLSDLGPDTEAAWSKAQLLATGILEALGAPYQVVPVATSGKSDQPARLITHRCSASIGVVLSRPGESDAQGLLDRADQAMYRAKQGGRNRVSN